MDNFKFWCGNKTSGSKSNWNRSIINIHEMFEKKKEKYQDSNENFYQDRKEIYQESIKFYQDWFFFS